MSLENLTRRRQRRKAIACALGMALSFGPISAALADDVDVTANTNTGLNLNAFAGTTARIFPGITVSNTGTLMPGGSFSGVAATTQAWTLTNQGTIDAQLGNAITFTQGGTVNNQGLIDTGFNGIRIQNGGNVTNAVGAVIEAGTSAVHVSGGGSLANSGQIIGQGAATAVNFDGGGTITNNVGARIEGNGAGNGLSLRGGTTRILTNHGTIVDVAGGFAAGVAMQGGTLTNGATGNITGSYNAIWAITGQPISIINAGMLTASTSGAAAIELQHGGSIQNSGTIQGGFGIEVLPGFGVTDASTAITNSGTITGTDGTAVLFRAGTNSLTLQTGSVLNGNVIGGPNADSLVLMGTGTEGINKFSNFETLSMQGTAWTLTGTGTFTTSSTVQSGVLNVNGQLTSPTLTVQSGGTLGGIGTITGAVNNSGNIAPGNSIGKLNIIGPYTQVSGSTYTVEVNSTASDLINVTGPATLQAQTGVNVLAAPGSYSVGKRYTILTASGGVTGTYSTLTDNAPFVDFGLFYDPNNVYLDVTRASVGFSSIAQTPNQRAAATGAEGLGSGNPVFDALLMLDTPNALRAFDQLSGEIHATIRSVLTDDSRFIRDGIFGRLRQFTSRITSAFGPQIAASYAAEDGGAALAYAGRRNLKAAIPAPLVTKASPIEGRIWTAWGHAFGNWGKTEGNGNAAVADHRTGGMIAGLDRTLDSAFGPTTRVGLAGGYQNHSVQVSGRNSSADIDTLHFAAYAATLNGPFALRIGAAHAWHRIDTRRGIAFPGFSDHVRAGYDGHSTQAFGELGYTLDHGSFALEPYIQLAYVHMKGGGFTETGGAAALTGLAAGGNSAFSTLGIRAASPLPGWSNAAMKGGLGWRHGLAADNPTTPLAFAGGTPFTIAGVSIGRDALVVEAGLDAAVAANTTIGVAYAGQYAGEKTDHTLRAQAQMRF